jgi:Apea-like HEPN/ApeA N-terminal domain 1
MNGMNLEQCSLDDSFEVFAHWWLPDAPTDRVPGTLTFSREDGPNLELQGVFNQSAFTDIRRILSNASLPDVERIFGERSNGQKITLQHALVTSIGGGTSTFHCQFIFVGDHVVAGIHDPAIGYFEYDNLEEWSCFNLLESLRSDLPSQHSYSVRDGPMELLSVPKNEHHPELDLIAIASQILTRNNVTFERRVYFQVTFGGTEFEKMLKFANDLAQFLSILMSKPAHLTRCVCILGSERGINIFFKRARGTSSGKIYAHDMSFPLLSLADRAVQLFSKWFSSADSMRSVYSTYFSTIFNDASYVDAKFQALVQAIEGFHRRTYGGLYLEESEYAQIRDKLVSAIPEGIELSLKERLKNAIKYGNEYSLRKRLKDIVGGLQPKTQEILRLNPSFQSDVVETRNYYAHLDDASKTRYVGDGAALYELNKRLSALFQILVLMSIGVPEEEAASRIVEHGMLLT